MALCCDLPRGIGGWKFLSEEMQMDMEVAENNPGDSIPWGAFIYAWSKALKVSSVTSSSFPQVTSLIKVVAWGVGPTK